MTDELKKSETANIAGRIFAFTTSLFLTFIGLTFVTFLIGKLTHIDPVLAIVGDHASQAVYDKTFHELGLGRPFMVQYGSYLLKLISGDFGVSVLTSHPVLQDLLHVFPATFELATLPLLLAY